MTLTAPKLIYRVMPKNEWMKPKEVWLRAVQLQPSISYHAICAGLKRMSEAGMLHHKARKYRYYSSL